MRKLRILAAAPSLAIVVGGLAAPGAHAAGVGGVAFEGTAVLQFPCSGPCAGGTFSGTASGSASGVDGTTPWSVTFASSSMTADFSYDEPAATCPAQGTASGTFDISGGTGRGKWGTEAVTSDVDATGTFTWTRLGATAVIHTEVDIWIGTHHTHVKDDATAAFATNGVPNCKNPGPITATVAGVDFIDG